MASRCHFRIGTVVVTAFLPTAQVIPVAGAGVRMAAYAMHEPTTRAGRAEVRTFGKRSAETGRPTSSAAVRVPKGRDTLAA